MIWGTKKRAESFISHLPFSRQSYPNGVYVMWLSFSVWWLNEGRGEPTWPLRESERKLVVTFTWRTAALQNREGESQRNRLLKQRCCVPRSKVRHQKVKTRGRSVWIHHTRKQKTGSNDCWCCDSNMLMLAAGSRQWWREYSQSYWLVQAACSAEGGNLRRDV